MGKYSEVENPVHPMGIKEWLSDGKIGFLNNDGSILSQPQWSWVSFFHHDVIKVKGIEGYGFLSTEGKIVLQPIWDEAFHVLPKLWKVKSQNLWGICEEAGLICPTIFTYIISVSEYSMLAKFCNHVVFCSWNAHTFTISLRGGRIEYSRLEKKFSIFSHCSHLIDCEPNECVSISQFIFF